MNYYAVFFSRVVAGNYKTNSPAIFYKLYDAMEYCQEMNEAGNGGYFVSEVKVKPVKKVKVNG